MRAADRSGSPISAQRPPDVYSPDLGGYCGLRVQTTRRSASRARCGPAGASLRRARRGLRHTSEAASEPPRLVSSCGSSDDEGRGFAVALLLTRRPLSEGGRTLGPAASFPAAPRFSDGPALPSPTSGGPALVRDEAVTKTASFRFSSRPSGNEGRGFAVALLLAGPPLLTTGPLDHPTRGFAVALLLAGRPLLTTA